MNRMVGKVVIVTGANSGIGKEAAAALADEGALVVMACRSAERGGKARAELLERNPARRLDLMALDLADLASVRKFAALFAERYDSLDVLVNNAGVLARRRVLTKDGFELSFGVNYLGPFALTLLLLPLLERAPQGRIVMTSSVAHKWKDIDRADLNTEKGYNRFLAYGRSKLCVLLFTRELARRLAAEGSRVTVNAAHPGIVASNIVVDRANGSLLWVAKLSRAVLLPARKGAETALFLACDPAAAGFSGKYFYRKKAVRSSPASYNRENAEWLFTESEKLTGIRLAVPALKNSTEGTP